MDIDEGKLNKPASVFHNRLRRNFYIAKVRCKLGSSKEAFAVEQKAVLMK